MRGIFLDNVYLGNLHNFSIPMSTVFELIFCLECHEELEKRGLSVKPTIELACLLLVIPLYLGAYRKEIVINLMAGFER